MNTERLRKRSEAESGSHSPLGDRQARFPGKERANPRQRRDSGKSAGAEVAATSLPALRKYFPVNIASTPKVCYNKPRKAVEICS